MSSQPQFEFQHDAFLVYAPEDREWAEGYLAPLIAPRERMITPSDIKPGDLKTNYIERAVQESRFTVLVYSRAFQSSPWMQNAQQMAEYLSVEEQSRRVITVKRDGTKLNLSLRTRQEVDCADPEQSAAMLAQLREDLHHAAPDQEDIPCPYPGMKPFSEQSPYFFGREKEIRRLQDALAEQHRVFLIGPSGSGKSSLVFAGLAPALQTAARGKWRIRTMRPGSRPMEPLCAALDSPPGMNLAASVSAILAKEPQAQKLLLIVDQFEELFTVSEESQRSSFVAALNEIAGLDTAAVLATHSSAYEEELLDLLRNSGKELQPGERMDVTPLAGDALRKAIVGPAEKAGVYIDLLLVERLVADSRAQRDESGVLPAVQETMVLLWERRQNRYISSEAYDSIRSGDAQGLSAALALKADGVLNRMADNQRQVAMRVFLRLIQFGDDGRNTRRQQPLAAAAAVEPDAELFFDTIERLRTASLVMLSGGSGHRGSQIDISHEALIQRWPRLHDWIETYRGPEQTRRWLEAKVADWVAAGEGRTCLLEKPELARAKEWSGAYAALLREPPKLAQLMAATEKWKWITYAMAGAVLLLLAAGGGILWRVQSTNTAMEGLFDASADPVDTLRAAYDATKKVGPRLEWLTVLQFAINRLAPDVRSLDDQIPERLAVSPDKLWLAVSTTGGVAHIWRCGSQPIWNCDPQKDAPDRPARRVSFGPASRLALAMGAGVTVIDLSTGQPQEMRGGAGGAVDALAWAPDGSVALAIRQHERQLVRIWRPLGGGVSDVGPTAAPVNALAFSSDGALLAAACEDGNVTMWLGPDWRHPETFRAGRALSDVAFRPQSHELVVASRLESAVTIWAPGRHDHPLRSLRGHREDETLRGVNSLTFDAAGHKLATGGNDGVVRIWDARDGKPLMIIRVENAEMRRLVAALNPEGTRVAAGTYGMVHFFDASALSVLRNAEETLAKYPANQ
jgi:WD40 repeat protein/energy-coupling factor transporter ATP-binding protein EcfA2